MNSRKKEILQRLTAFEGSREKYQNVITRRVECIVIRGKKEKPIRVPSVALPLLSSRSIGFFACRICAHVHDGLILLRTLLLTP